ncbi:MAG: putative quinol monooxygenase [Thermoanaerobaculia bacterium]|jgi:quinol monooxygenase YgiN
MRDTTLRVIAHFRAQPGREADLKHVLVGLIEPTREEAGCIGYELLENLEDRREFTFVEEWQGESALEAHFSTDHVASALQEFPAVLAQELDLRKYRLLG